MPLADNGRANSGDTTVSSNSKGSSKNSNNNKNGKNNKKGRNQSGSKKKGPTVTTVEPIFLPQFPTSSDSAPPPLMSPHTDEAQDVMGVGLCGGLNYCEGAFKRGSDSSIGLNSISMGGSESVDTIATALKGLLTEKNKKTVDTDLYAMHHDEIVTALIDEALRNGSGGGGTADNNTAASTPVEESQPPPLIEIKESSGGIARSNHSLTPSQAPSNHSVTPSSDNASFKANGKNPRSPYRMSRNISKSLAITSPQKLRKRQRNSSASGTSDNGNTHYKRSPSSAASVSSKQKPSVKQSMLLNLNSASGSRSSSPIKDMQSTSSLPLPNKGDNGSMATNAANKTVAGYLHPQCILRKENPKKKMGAFKSKKGENDNNATSAVGREETLLKLQKKLSMLGDIESGKFGKAAEMLRSDAVAFVIEGAGAIASAVTKVETRSILTLRMGFVSMSYGILLQWDCSSRLVEMIVLRKMCRDDFLKGKKNDSTELRSISRKDLPSSSAANGGGSGRSSGRPPLAPLSPPSKMPDLIPIPATEMDASSHSHSIDDVEENEENDLVVTYPDWPENSRGTRLPSLPKIPSGLVFPWPHNPLAGLPRLLSSAINPAATPVDSDSGPPSFLSVSVLNVKQLHGGCDHCRSPMYMGGGWSSLIGRNSSNNNTSNRSSTHNRSPRNRHSHNPRQRKRKQTIRPYIRFVLGKHEHCTKITKNNKGNPVWSKRHHNSCLLPCPPDELRWFAAQEDLVVEVRNDWRVNGRQQVNNSGQQINSGGLFGSKSSEDDTPVNEDPILAVVTVPLSSINIEEEDDNSNNDHSNSDTGKKEGKGSTFKRRTSKAKNGASSTNITIPLCMSCCSHAPVGSISLKITIKVPSRPEGGEAAATNNSSRSVVNNASVIPSVPSLPNSSVDISDLQVDINIRGSGSSSTGGNGEPKVNESIELGPLSILMDGWSLGGSGACSKEQSATAAAKDNPASKESQTTTSTATAALPNNRKSTSPQSQSGSPRNTTTTNNNGGNNKRRKRLRWSKQFDHQTKKWSNLKNSDPTTSSNGSGGTTPPSSSSTKNGPSSPSSKNPSPKKEEEAIATNDGWFTFLNRGV